MPHAVEKAVSISGHADDTEPLTGGVVADVVEVSCISGWSRVVGLADPSVGRAQKCPIVCEISQSCVARLRGVSGSSTHGRSMGRTASVMRVVVRGGLGVHVAGVGVASRWHTMVLGRSGPGTPRRHQSLVAPRCRRRRSCLAPVPQMQAVLGVDVCQSCVRAASSASA